MPHQCTSCGRTFPDGSKEMLSGCPDCGGNKFQFQPDTGSKAKNSTANRSAARNPAADNSSANDSTSEAEESGSPFDSPVTDSPPEDTVPEGTPSAGSGSASSSSSSSPSDSAADRESDSTPGSGPAQSHTERVDERTEDVDERTEEDVAQASARSDVVSPDELDQASRDVDTESDLDTPSDDTPGGPRPDIGDLRDELNDQFESIRIVSPGKYELNLMELYDRQEYIISLQEDGRYVIEMPDAWGISDE